MIDHARTAFVRYGTALRNINLRDIRTKKSTIAQSIASSIPELYASA
jgi:hypothetical protein